MLARRAIANALRGAPEMVSDSAVLERKQELLAEADVTLAAIRALASAQVRDPLADPATLSKAVTSGILDAPHLKHNPCARGQIVTRIDGRGACIAVDPTAEKALCEEERISRLA